MKRAGFIFLLIFFLGTLLYVNTFGAGFYFDSLSGIQDNVHIRSLPNLRLLWEHYPLRFLTYLSFAFNYHFGKLDVFGYHLVNLLIHLLTSCVVYGLVTVLFETPRMNQNPLKPQKELLASLSSLFFLVHPVQTQAVTYLVQRATSLTTFFYLLSLVFYLKGRLKRSAFYQGSAFLTTVAAMLSKPMAITLPITLVLVEFLFLESRKGGKRWLPLFPFFLTLAIIPSLVFFYGTDEFGGADAFTRQTLLLSRGTYFLTQLNVLRTYLRLLFLPVNQNLDYDYPVSHALFEPGTFFSLFLLLGLLLLGVWLIPRRRLISFGIFFFFVALSAESSIYPLEDVIFEHRLYLPMAGFSIALPVILGHLLEARHVLTAVFLVIFSLSSVATVRRNAVWKDSVTLWEDTVRKSPGKPRPHYNLGLAYARQGEDERAIQAWKKAIEKNPPPLRLAEVYRNLGVVSTRKGEGDQALAYFEKALELDPENPEIHNNLGYIFFTKGEYERSAGFYQKALKRSPSSVEAHEGLKIAQERLKWQKGALE